MDKVFEVSTAQEAHELIERKAKELAVAEVRRVAAIEIGQVVRQGDIYVHRVADSHPRGKPAASPQLAIGATMGSRHVAPAPAVVFEGAEAPDWCQVDTFLGPVIVSGERFTITHPEHAHVELPAGVYQVTHQLDARTRERVTD